MLLLGPNCDRCQDQSVSKTADLMGFSSLGDIYNSGSPSSDHQPSQKKWFKSVLKDILILTE